MKIMNYILASCLLASVISVPVSAEEIPEADQQVTQEQPLSSRDTEAETGFIYGDVDGNGVAEVTDLIKISLFLLKDITLTEQQQKAADVDGDNEVSISDLSTMKEFVMHEITVLGKHTDKISALSNEETKFKKLHSTTSMHSYGIYDQNDRRVTVIQSVLDSTAKEFKETFGNDYENICVGLGVTSQFLKDNFLCIITYADTEDKNMQNEIRKLSLVNDNRVTVVLTSASYRERYEEPYSVVGGTINGEHTGMHLAFTLPKKYLNDSSTFTFDVTNETDLSPIDIDKCRELSYRCSRDSTVKDNQKSAIIKSVSELDNYLGQFSENTVDEFRDRSKYMNISDEMFKDNTMVIANLQYDSASYTDKISQLGINQNNQILFQITSTLPQVVSSDMLQYQYALIIPNRYLENTDLSELDFSNVIYRFSVSNQ